MKFMTIWRRDGLRAVLPWGVLSYLTTIKVTHGVTWFGDAYKCITLTGHDESGFQTFCLEGMHVSEPNREHYYLNIFFGELEDWCEPGNRECIECNSAHELWRLMRQIERDLTLIN